MHIYTYIFSVICKCTKPHTSIHVTYIDKHRDRCSHLHAHVHTCIRSFGSILPPTKSGFIGPARTQRVVIILCA